MRLLASRTGVSVIRNPLRLYASYACGLLAAAAGAAGAAGVGAAAGEEEVPIMEKRSFEAEAEAGAAGPVD